MNIFKAAEVLKIALQIEKNGMAFFNEAKQKARDFSVQQIFDYLAKQETEHARIFQGMLDTVGDYQPAESYPGEYAQYLEGLAGENIFTKTSPAKDLAKKAQSDATAVEVGIGFEKDSILFYNDIKRIVPPADQPVIEKIIEEEKKHLRILIELKNKAKL